MTLSAAKPYRLNHAWVLEGSETIAYGSISAESFTTVLEAKGLRSETFYLKNTTDVEVTVQVQASPDGLDGSDWFDVGSSTVLGIGSVTATTAYLSADADYHPFYRLKITRGLTAPTTGSLAIKARGQGGA